MRAINVKHGLFTNWLLNGCRFPGTVLVIYENRIYQCQPVFSRNRRGWKLDRMVVTVSVVGRHESVVVFTGDCSGRACHRYVLTIRMAVELLEKKVYLGQCKPSLCCYNRTWFVNAWCLVFTFPIHGVVLH